MVAIVVVSPQVLTLTRAQTIYRVVKEFVEEIAGFPASEILRRGIVEQPLLRAIYVMLVNEERRKIAEVVLTIDWEKHRVLASAIGMNAFQFDTKRSICEQVSDALRVLRQFVAGLRGKNVRAEVWYGVRSDLNMPYDQACAVLGLTAGTAEELEWAKGKYVHGIFKAARLEELHIDIRTMVE
jgi:hypothetical protein